MDEAELRGRLERIENDLVEGNRVLQAQRRLLQARCDEMEGRWNRACLLLRSVLRLGGADEALIDEIKHHLGYIPKPR